MPESSDDNNSLTHLGDSLPEIIGPKKGEHLARAEERLRVALGEEGGRHFRMKGDLWLIGAIRLAVEALDKPFDYETNSLQKSLLQQLHDKNPEGDVWTQFEKAKKVRLEALTDIASRALTGRPYEEVGKQIGDSASLNMAIIAPGIPGIIEKAAKIFESDETGDRKSAGGKDDSADSREFTLLRLATLFPDRILPNAAFRQMVNLALAAGRGQGLIEKIAKGFRNTIAAKKTLGIDETEIALVVNWTNPHFPLWLAAEKALAAILRNQFGLNDVSEEGVRKMRNRKLRCDSPYPILDMNVYKDRPHEFVLGQGLQVDFPSLEGDSTAES